LLLLAPEVDPPAGFTRRVVAGLTPGRRRWRPMALAAVAALVIGLAVGYVPGHVGSGSANVAVASFVDTGAEPGETVGGRVYARADNPSCVLITVHRSGSHESYACDLVLKDRRPVPIGRFTLHPGA